MTRLINCPMCMKITVRDSHQCNEISREQQKRINLLCLGRIDKTSIQDTIEMKSCRVCLGIHSAEMVNKDYCPVMDNKDQYSNSTKTLDKKLLVMGEPDEYLTYPEESDKNKYMREILPNVWVDVYDVINAFEVTDGGMAHALKKILATGKRGHKDEAEDRKDILASIKRSNEIFDRKK